MADEKPIIIIKKKGGHGGHHGGAWKVAYADFVTAMMAFFMVMWLVNSADVTTKQNIASYFRKPGIFESGSGTPLLMGEAGILQDGYVPPHPEDTKQLYQGKSKEFLKEKSGTDSNSTGNKRVTYRGETGKRDSVPDEDVAQRGFQSHAPDNIVTAKEITLDIAHSGGGESKDYGGGQTEAIKKNTKSGEELGIINKKAVGIAEEEKELKNIEDANSPPQPGEGGETQGIAKDKMAMQAAAEKLKQQIANSPELQKLLGIVDVKVDADGLNIDIMDTAKSSMFQSGSAQISSEAENAFQKIAPIIAQVPNKIDIIGHTDSTPFSNRPGGYSNWELSADRANAARRLLTKYGVIESRIASVTGRADQELKVPVEPSNPSNRRITLKLRFMNQAPTTKSAESLLGLKSSEESKVIRPKTEYSKPEIIPTLSSIDTAEPILDDKPKIKPTPQPFNPKDIVKPDKLFKKPRIKLPNESPTAENPEYMQRDKIFGDSPVIGPKDPFANF